MRLLPRLSVRTGALARCVRWYDTSTSMSEIQKVLIFVMSDVMSDTYSIRFLMIISDKEKRSEKPDSSFRCVSLYRASYFKTLYRIATHPESFYPKTTHPRTAYPKSAYPKTTYPRTTYLRTAYPRTAYPRTAYHRTVSLRLDHPISCSDMTLASTVSTLGTLA